MKNGQTPILILLVVLPLCTLPLSAQSSNDPHSRAVKIVQQMTLEEKIDYIGTSIVTVRGLPRLRIPDLLMSDGPFGIRQDSGFPSTVYAGGIGLAASWNPELAERVGAGIGRDARARGVHFVLGPGVNIYREPMNGRNFEYFGEDPFLAATIVVGYVKGVQSQGVSATIKHFLGNNSEFLRHDSDSIIDERTAREIYLPTFEAAVKRAHVGSIMDSYNLTNGLHMTQNGHFNTDIVRHEWGFDGVIMSDFVSTYDGIAAANGGLDLEVPGGLSMNAKTLLPAIQDGRVKASSIDEKIVHILQTAARFGWLDRAATDFSISTYSETNHQLALQSARETMVLLKNKDSLLPLDKSKTRSVLVVGPDAFPAQAVGGGSAHTAPFAPVSVLEGISTFLGTSSVVYYHRGLPSMVDLARSTEFVTAPQNGERGLKLETFDNLDLSGTPKSTERVNHINVKGITWDDVAEDYETAVALFSSPPKTVSRRWTGYYIAAETGPFEIALQGDQEGTGNRLYVDDKLVIDNWRLCRAQQPHVSLQLSAGPHKIAAEDFQNSQVGGTLRVGIADQHQLVSDAAKTLAPKVDAVIIAVGFDPASESEGCDRSFELPFGQEELIRELSAANPKTVIALTAGGNVDPGTWLDLVPAYIDMWYPGEQGGTALAEILFGAVNPSGRLPATFERRLEDNPSFASYYPGNGTNRIVYSNGVFVGYRGYEHGGAKSLFPFGYGLSYTSFKYANLRISPARPGQSSLYSVAFDLTNTGERAGAEVAQVYVADDHSKIARPPKELKGFAKVTLQPGETKHVAIALDARAFAYFDVATKKWRITAGTFGILVGRSSADILLKGTVEVSQVMANEDM